MQRIAPYWIALLALLAPGLHGAPMASAALPPPDRGEVDFDRDIAPIFARSCLRCHGAQRPKGRFRLDSREAALKGGREGRDVIPGDSARSPLIRYVAQMDDEITMPPGNNPKLTAREVGLLRAWIDQGAHWGVPEIFHGGPVFEMETTMGGLSLHGNSGKFRELEETRDGLDGGVKHFSFEEQLARDEKFSAEGHYLAANQDLQLKLGLVKDDIGSINAGFEQWRDYSEKGGGFDALAHPSAFMINSNLYLDEGKAWIDFNLALPDRPVIRLGYEYQYRNGAESTLDWGTAQGVNIYPATTELNESTHILKLDVAGDWAGWHGEDSARAEFHSLNNNDVEPNILGTGPDPDTLINTRNTDRSVQGMNTLTVERQFQDWCHVSAGYFYSHLEADDSLSQSTTGPNGALFFGNYWSSPQVTLSMSSHIFSVSAQFIPAENLTLSLASQTEWSHEEGFGEADLSTGLPTVPGSFNLFPVANDSNLDEFKAMQNAGVRFSKIPWTVLFADARFSQDEVGEYQDQIGDVPEAFNRKTDSIEAVADLRSGFSFSPVRWLSWDTEYHLNSSDIHYNHVIDSTPLTGYPAFILRRDITTHDVETKLIMRPATWLKATLSYELAATDFSSSTDPVAGGISPGGPLTAGVYDARNYGLNVTLTPWRPFYLSSALTHGDSSTVTYNNGDPSVVPYRGHTWTLLSTAGCALSKTVDLSAGYAYSEANYGQDNAADGVPLGLDFVRHNLSVGITKKINASLSFNLRYFLATYREPNTAGFNDYTAQGAFATITYAWR